MLEHALWYTVTSFHFITLYSLFLSYMHAAALSVKASKGAEAKAYAEKSHSDEAKADLFQLELAAATSALHFLHGISKAVSPTAVRA